MLSTWKELYTKSTHLVVKTTQDFCLSANSSGPLIDGDGIIYIFGDNGKVVALNSNLVKLGEYTIGQQITTTPAIVKGVDGVTYLIVTSSTTAAGKITILSFDAVTGVFTKVWEYAVPSTFPISAAVKRCATWCTVWR